jgi:addiction module RelE/StbE family toxin
MACRVVWSPEAVEDLEEIAEYICRDSKFYASAVVTKIVNASQALATFPKSGRVVPEQGDENVRERFIYSYRLIYRIEKEKILVVAVVHGKRLLELISERFK